MSIDISKRFPVIIMASVFASSLFREISQNSIRVNREVPPPLHVLGIVEIDA